MGDRRPAFAPFSSRRTTQGSALALRDLCGLLFKLCSHVPVSPGAANPSPQKSMTSQESFGLCSFYLLFASFLLGGFVALREILFLSFQALPRSGRSHAKPQSRKKITQKIQPPLWVGADQPIALLRLGEAAHRLHGVYSSSAVAPPHRRACPGVSSASSSPALPGRGKRKPGRRAR